MLLHKTAIALLAVTLALGPWLPRAIACDDPPAGGCVQLPSENDPTPTAQPQDGTSNTTPPPGDALSAAAKPKSVKTIDIPPDKSPPRSPPEGAPSP